MIMTHTENTKEDQLTLPYVKIRLGNLEKIIRRLSRARNRAEITINHGNDMITLMYPPHGGGVSTYGSIRETILRDGLEPMDAAQLASLLESIQGFYDDEGKIGVDTGVGVKGDINTTRPIRDTIIDLFGGIGCERTAEFYVNVGTLARNGNIYTQINPPFNHGNIAEEAMERYLNGTHWTEDSKGVFRSPDKRAGYTKWNFKEGEQTPEELAKNRFMILIAGEDGAKKYAEFATQRWLFGECAPFLRGCYAFNKRTDKKDTFKHGGLLSFSNCRGNSDNPRTSTGFNISPWGNANVGSGGGVYSFGIKKNKTHTIDQILGKVLASSYYPAP